MAENKFVYFFGDNQTDGNGSMKDLLGGKGANLAEMANLGVPVPPGFTITTQVCVYYLEHGKYPSGLLQQINDAIKKLEKINNKKFGDSHNPLLLSVRSGAKASMPGMMDTVLNLGLNDESVKGLARKQITRDLLMIATDDSWQCLVMLFLESIMMNSKQ